MSALSAYELELDVVFGGVVSSYPINKNDGEIIVGRNDNNNYRAVDISINCSAVSPRHFKITSKGSVLTVMDLESKAGTYLNGVKLVPNVEYPIWGEAHLTIGDNLVRLYVRSPGVWLPYMRRMAQASWNNR